MADTRIVSIIGHKNTGKTTLTVALADEFHRRGKRVMTIKHGHHSPDVDRQGTDSWKHFNEGKAERVLLVAPDRRVLFERAPDEYDPEGLARRYLQGADVVLVEGFKRSTLPTIEVFRRAVASRPLVLDAEDPSRWIALVTDDPKAQAPCRVLRFQDTMWLHLLATLAWDAAKPLAP